MAESTDKEIIQLLMNRMSVQTPVLVLGAGFSAGAINKDDKPLPTGSELAQELFDQVLAKNKNINSEDMDAYRMESHDLKKTCDNLRFSGMKKERDDYLTRRFSNCHCAPDDCRMQLKSIDWKYIFTLNIDNLVEFIYSTLPKKNRPKVHIKNSSALDSTATLELFKPHGSVQAPSLGYVFDSEEYRILIADSNWTMNRFAELFLTNDVIFLGTTFQEDDFLIMIQKYLSMVRIEKPYHYFFISRSLKNRGLRHQIEMNQNMHHIPWTTDQFFNYVKKNVTDITDMRRKMRDYGMVFYEEKLKEASSELPRYIGGLYTGDMPRPIDFFKNLDVIRPELVGKAKDIAVKGGRQLLAIIGIAYVGKTCAALRLGVDLMTCGYDFCVFNFSYYENASAYQQLLLEYLGSLPEGSKVAIFSENMAYYYNYVRYIMERCPSKINSLVFICTASPQDHNSKKYCLEQYEGLEEIYITEKTKDHRMAEAIYDKLEMNSHLGKLIAYGDNRRERIQYIRSLNDLIEVLYVAQEGRGFIAHFSDWIKRMPDNDTKDGFLLLCCLSQLGVPNLTMPLFRDILVYNGIQLNISNFLKEYADLVQVESSRVKLRCSRLLWSSAREQMEQSRIQCWVKTAAALLARNLREREETIQNEIFQKLIKTKSLQHLLMIPTDSVMDTLLELEPSCGHLSYYWVQRGICHRELEHFEEANNAFCQAANIRNNTSFHIKHAQAKNYMAWGIWALNHQPNHAVYFFDQGKESLEQLILEAPDRYFAYSVHTYVDMILHFHRVSRFPISDGKLEEYSILLDRLMRNFRDHMAAQIVKKFLDYCAQRGNEPEAVRELRELYRKTTLPSCQYEVYFDSDEFED